MTRHEIKKGSRILPLGELLSKLPSINLEKKQLSKQLLDLPLETNLLSLANISIEHETELLREILEFQDKGES